MEEVEYFGILIIEEDVGAQQTEEKNEEFGSHEEPRRHDFILRKFAEPIQCDECQRYIWGILSIGFRCSGTKIFHYFFRISDPFSSFPSVQKYLSFALPSFNENEKLYTQFRAIQTG